MRQAAFDSSRARAGRRARAREDLFGETSPKVSSPFPNKHHAKVREGTQRKEQEEFPIVDLVTRNRFRPLSPSLEGLTQESRLARNPQSEIRNPKLLLPLRQTVT